MSPGSAMTGHDDVERLVAAITIDCYNRAEQVTAFYETFPEEAPARQIKYNVMASTANSAATPTGVPPNGDPNVTIFATSI